MKKQPPTAQKLPGDDPLAKPSAETIQVRIPYEMHATLKRIARDRRWSLSRTARMAIQYGLNAATANAIHPDR